MNKFFKFEWSYKYSISLSYAAVLAAGITIYNHTGNIWWLITPPLVYALGRTDEQVKQQEKLNA
jgi:hypothetical protein